MPTSLFCVNGLSCSPQLLGLDRLLHLLAGLAGSSRSGQDEVDQYLREGAGAERLFTVAQNIYYTRGGSLDESTMRDLVMYAYSEGSESGKQLISQVERDTVSDEEWEEFKAEAEMPEPISDDEWGLAEMSVDERSEDNENS
ncbi:hypothetical protein N7527_006487 [Penicillium freii]|nr:hypothetical protein N7527_006487 [Penicillium freii]